MGWSKILKDLLNPVIELLRVAPPLAYIPFFVIWFGLTNASFILMVAFVTSLLIVVNTYEATQNVSKQYQEFARTLGASKKETYISVVLPSIVPELRGGIRVALGLAWGITIIAEIIGAQVGMGIIFNSWISLSAADNILAGIILISALALLTDSLVTGYIKMKTKWSTSQ
jgi:NitT/TauT family transport system permease protein/sulfonate transport system permease protein